jgi:hypothetical protein
LPFLSIDLKTVMCKYYAKNTCANQACRYAHEGDGNVKLVPFTRLKAAKECERSASPVELKGEARKGDEVQREGEGEDAEMT